MMLFTDGSVHSKLNIGFGAYLLISAEKWTAEALKKAVKVKRFDDTTSTKLELQILLFALNEIPNNAQKITIYTDSQNIIGLPARQNRLEQNNYYSAKNKLLTNHELYRSFYKITNQLDCEFVKVVGHAPKSKKNTIDQFFTLVDKASRKALREATRS
ncbi:MAG: ribonuclease HI [Saprospiraceae bacterium]